MANRAIKHSVDVPVEPEEVYGYLTEERKLEKWFPSSAKTEPKPGGTYEFAFKTPDGKADHEREGTFGKLEPGKHVEYDWDFGAGPTTVKFDIQGNGSGSHVVLTHEGFGSTPAMKEAYQMHDKGWGMFMNNLASVVSGGKDLRKEM
jgi:uncharacterized protein YndB with AHSA1/START domain